MAKIRPEYVTDTDTRPNSARNAKYNSNEVGKYSAMPVGNYYKLIKNK